MPTKSACVCCLLQLVATIGRQVGRLPLVDDRYLPSDLNLRCEGLAAGRHSRLLELCTTGSRDAVGTRVRAFLVLFRAARLLGPWSSDEPSSPL